MVTCLSRLVVPTRRHGPVVRPYLGIITLSQPPWTLLSSSSRALMPLVSVTTWRPRGLWQGLPRLAWRWIGTPSLHSLFPEEYRFASPSKSSLLLPKPIQK